MGSKILTDRIRVHTRNAGGTKSSDECVISAHGLRTGWNKGEPDKFTMFSGGTLVFYGPDHQSLNDPGWRKAFYGTLVPYETFGKNIPQYNTIYKGPQCPDYHLAKYQGKHKDSAFGWTGSIKEAWRKLGDSTGTEPESWETYDKILQTMGSTRSKAQDEHTKQLELAAENANLQQVSVKLRNAKTALFKLIWEKNVPIEWFWSLKESLQNSTALFKLETTVKDTQMKPKITAVRKALAEFERSSHARNVVQTELNRLAALATSPPKDFVTIRYRPGKLLGTGTVLLSQVMQDLKKHGYNYDVIHCSFCRSGLRDKKSYTAPDDPNVWMPKT